MGPEEQAALQRCRLCQLSRLAHQRCAQNRRHLAQKSCRQQTRGNKPATSPATPAAKRWRQHPSCLPCCDFTAAGHAVDKPLLTSALALMTLLHTEADGSCRKRETPLASTTGVRNTLCSSIVSAFFVACGVCCMTRKRSLRSRSAAGRERKIRGRMTHAEGDGCHKGCPPPRHCPTHSAWWGDASRALRPTRCPACHPRRLRSL